MPYVSARLTEGLGNRFFQVAAMLGYAAAHGHTPIFVRTWITENRTHPGPKTIFDFFQDIPVVENPPDDWTVYSENGDDCFTFKPIPFIKGNVKLEGCFQSEKYAPPCGVIVPAILKTCNSYNMLDLRSAAFMHVRRGDYLNPYCAHHHVDLSGYYRRALMCVGDGPIVVCSDDINWCKSMLPVLYDGLVRRDAWMFVEGLSDYETLGLMIRCGRGAIAANSTFSWWGAYWGCASRPAWFFPDTWGHPPLPPARDIYPTGATVLSVKN